MKLLWEKSGQFEEKIRLAHRARRFSSTSWAQNPAAFRGRRARTRAADEASGLRRRRRHAKDRSESSGGRQGRLREGIADVKEGDPGQKDRHPPLPSFLSPASSSKALLARSAPAARVGSASGSAPSFLLPAARLPRPARTLGSSGSRRLGSPRFFENPLP